MKKIYSEIDEKVLLAILVGIEDFVKERNEIIPETEFIQSAAMSLNKGRKFRAHRHIWKQLNSVYGFGQVITQECWLMMHGTIHVTLYDVNDQERCSMNLYAGDVLFMLQGGHAFECMEDDTLMWEFKTGPYEGQAKDKVFIDE